MSVNFYFDGAVKSIGFSNSEGDVSTGVMLPGSYEFNTTKDEKMVVTSGKLQISFPDGTAGGEYSTGHEFYVAAGQSFQVVASEATAYLCFYK